MARRKGIPSYGHHRPTGQARVRIDGKDHYLGLYGSEESRQAYERLVRKLIADRAAVELKARVEIASDLAIHELIASYLEFAKGYYVKHGRETTEYGVIATTLRLLKHRHGDELVSTFGPLKLLALRDQWADDGIVRKQCNHRMERVRRMFTWAVSRQLVATSVLEALKTVEGLRKGRTHAVEGRTVMPVADAHVDAVQPHVSRQVWTMIRLQRLAGMRPEEVTLMRTIDIDASGDVWAYRPRYHKTEHHDQDRVVYLGPQAIEIVRPWLRLNLEEYLFQPAEAMAELAVKRRAARKTKVQPSQQSRRAQRPKKRPGDRYSTGSYRQAIHAACDRAFPHPDLDAIPERDLTDAQRDELKAWRKSHRWQPNQLRHTVATRIRQQVGLEAAQAVLGHSSVLPTQIYAKRDEQAARDAMARLG